MRSRRSFISSIAFGTAGLLAIEPLVAQARNEKRTFRYCLNTSTIRGQNPGLEGYFKIASDAGYDGIELWVRDINDYLSAGNSKESLKGAIIKSGLIVENAIGFAPWLKDKKGMQQMREEMELMASIGCKRIAAPASEHKPGEKLDFNYAGEKFHELLEIGNEIGIQPCLEFWGTSPVLSTIGQAMLIAANANHPDVQILADVYHMFRGNSGFNSLQMLNGKILEVFHMNDYVDTIPREKQTDSDRVYPDDGVAPLKQILADLKNMGGPKVLSIELFNPSYWQQDAATVAKTGLHKMKKLVSEIS